MNRIAILTLGSLHSFGGVERFTWLLKSVIEDKGTKVDVFHAGVLPSKEVPRSARFLGLEQAYLARRLSRLLLREHRNKGAYDLVISNQAAGWPIGTINAINIYHGTLAGFSESVKDSMPLRNFLQSRYIQSEFEKLSGIGKTIVAVSRRVAGEVKRYYHLDAKNVIYNGIDTEHFRRRISSNLKGSLGLPEETFLGLFVGRFEFAKGYDILLQISRKLPDNIVIATVGKGSRVIQSRNIRNVGTRDYDELPNIYSGADFFIFPSRYEGCGLTILEAMACEVPVITSNVGAVGETMKRNKILGENVVDTYDANDYVDRIIRMKSSSSDLRELQEESRRIVCKQFSIDGFRRNYRELILSSISNN